MCVCDLMVSDVIFASVAFLQFLQTLPPVPSCEPSAREKLLQAPGLQGSWEIIVYGLGDVGDEAEELRDLQCFLSKDHSE